MLMISKLFCRIWGFPWLLSTLLLSLTFLQSSGVVHAQQRELKTDTTEAVDAVLLLDASGSMLLTDPTRLRDEGTRLFLQFLKAGDRLAIVQFAEEAKVVRDLSPFDPTQVEGTLKQISAISSSGQYTDILAAMTTALATLEKDARSDAKALVVLLSDGKMDPDPKRGSASSFTEKLMNEVLPEMKSKGIKTYTLSFSDEADKELLSQISASTEGLNRYTPTADKIHESFADLFLAVKKPQVVPMSAKGFTIDKEVSEATFYINREESGHEIHLQPPTGGEITATTQAPNIRWFQGQKFDVITITAPESGAWQVVGISPNEGFATILTNLKLITDWPSTIDEGEGALLQARLYEEKKPVALPEMTGAIRFAFQVTPTDKIAEPIIRDFLVDDGTKGDKIAGDGIFSYRVTVADAGEYRLRVIAKAPTFERQQQLPFRVRAPLITVSVQTQSEEAEGEKTKPEAAHAKEEGGGHAEEATHESPAKEEKEKSKKESILSGDENSVIEIELSEETLEYKNLQVKLTAVDKTRQRIVIPVTKPGSNPLRYEIPVSALPRDGEYELQATLTADSKSKKPVKEVSRPVRFERISKGGTQEVVVQVVEEHKEEQDTFPWIGLLLVTLVNAGAGFFAMKKVQETQTEKLDDAPDLSLPESLVSGISDLEKKLALTEVDLKDALYAEEGEGALEATPVAESAPAEAEQTAAPEPESAEEQAEAEPPAEEAPAE